MIKAVLLFVVGLVLLIVGGDKFVEAATSIAHRFHVPELVIGATVVSIGTTLPEVMVSATSALTGHGEIAYGNAIGSIICNTALIAAITIAVKPGKVDKKPLRIPVMVFFLAAAIYCVAAYILQRFARPVGILLLLVFAIYMVLLLKSAKDEKTEAASDGEETGRPLFKDILFIVLGAAAIAFGARLLVDNGTIIARELGVPESVIALTFVALGTSLPELVTAVTSLIKGHGALSLGNVIGANVFNLVLVSGVSVVLAPFDLPAGKTLAGINSSLLVDIPVMLLVMLILTIYPLKKGELKRWQGISLLAIYALFCVYQFMS